MVHDKCGGAPSYSTIVCLLDARTDEEAWRKIKIVPAVEKFSHPLQRQRWLWEVRCESAERYH